MRQRERDRSGKRASEGGTTECVLVADSPVTLAFAAAFAQTLYSFNHLTTRLTPPSFTTSK